MAAANRSRDHPGHKARPARPEAMAKVGDPANLVRMLNQPPNSPKPNNAISRASQRRTDHLGLPARPAPMGIPVRPAKMHKAEDKDHPALQARPVLMETPVGPARVVLPVQLDKFTTCPAERDQQAHPVLTANPADPELQVQTANRVNRVNRARLGIKGQSDLLEIRAHPGNQAQTATTEAKGDATTAHHHAPPRAIRLVEWDGTNVDIVGDIARSIILLSVSLVVAKHCTSNK